MMRILIPLLLPVMLFALEAKVKLEIDKNQEFFVTKKIIVLLKVMSTGFKISNLEVDSSSNSDFVIISPESASYNESEGEFNGVVYEYEIYPLKGSTLELKPWIVSFDASAGYGMKQEHFSKKTSPKRLKIDSIKGHDFLLATPSMKIETAFSPKKKTYQIGDAIQRRTTIRAKEVIDLLIPSIPPYYMDGLQVYIDEPKLSQDKDENSLLVSTRIQTETYVFVKDGNYSFKQQTLPWYNTKTKKVLILRTKGFEFNVQALVVVKEEPKEKFELKALYLVYILSFLIMIYILYKYIVQKIKSHKKIKKRARSLLVESINPKEEVQ